MKEIRGLVDRFHGIAYPLMDKGLSEEEEVDEEIDENTINHTGESDSLEIQYTYKPAPGKK